MANAKRYRAMRSMTRRWERALVSVISWALFFFVEPTLWDKPSIWFKFAAITYSAIPLAFFDFVYRRLFATFLILGDQGLTFEGITYTFDNLDTVALSPKANVVVLLKDRSGTKIFVKLYKAERARIQKDLRSWANEHGIPFRHVEEVMRWSQLFRVALFKTNR